MGSGLRRPVRVMYKSVFSEHLTPISQIQRQHLHSTNNWGKNGSKGVWLGLFGWGFFQFRGGYNN